MKDDLLSQRIYLLLTFVSGLILLLPCLIYQDMFAQGDHGRDLYAYAMTLKGALPYRDYFWQYGPLMPYYYAFFLKWLGPSISSILFAETLLKLAGGVTFFAIMRQSATAAWSFLSTLFFWSFFPYFFHTYSHTGGILFVLLIILTLVKYINRPNPSVLYWGSFFLFIFSLIKINFGVCLWGGYLICIFIIDRNRGITLEKRKLYYALSLGILPLLTILIYYFLIRGVPAYIINQCFPFSKTGGVYSIDPRELPNRIYTLLSLFAKSSWQNAVFLVLSTSSIIGFLFQYKKIDPSHRKQIGFTLISLSFFSILFLHEFYFSGLHYRALWAIPMLLLIVFITAHYILKNRPRIFKVLFMALLAGMILSKTDDRFKNLEAHAHGSYFFSPERAGVLLGNDKAWFDTVSQTVNFLKRNLTQDEYFFALPYDPLFYYLFNQESPTYQIDFYDYMSIPEEQDRQSVKDLEQKHVNWIVMSNSVKFVESSMGEFGVTNSPLLAKYIRDNFYPVMEVGPWETKPFWNTNYAIRILKRK